MGLRDSIRSILAKPEDLAALRDALSALPPPAAPERQVLDHDARRAIADELRERVAQVTAAREAADAEVTKLEQERARIREKLAVAYQRAAEVTPLGFSAWLEEQRAALWNGRPALADALIAKANHEADALKPDIVTIPKSHHHESIAVSNGASIEARRAALRRLVELLTSATRRGADEAELSALWREEHAKLPAIEPVGEVVSRFPQAQAHEGLIDRVRRRFAPSLPPAA